MTVSNPVEERITDVSDSATHQEVHCTAAAIEALRPSDEETNVVWRKVLESEASCSH